MATFYLDFVGGNDTNDGTTFANRWKTFASGATSARIAPGDTTRVMASPNETSLSQNATWTQDSKTITLTTAVTANISDCETAWTASANVTSTADASLFKENTKSAKHVIAAGFTTGLASFFATGTVDLSGYQQVSFWVYNTAAVAASTLSLRLCSDVAGVTTVNTIAIPATASTSNWVAFTVDTAGALGSSIKSVALYCDLDPGAVTIYLDNIIACKASSSADSLSLTSLIGKVWNVCWVASATYATNDIRKPTQPNRNGFRYKVTAGGGGAAGGSEPTWPLEIGVTVTDGALTWTCEGLEDSWYPIQSVNGTTIKVDNINATTGAAGRGYPGTTETVTAYKRETIKLAMVTAAGTVMHAAGENGSDGLPETYSGGWNTTDMSTQTGETWVSGQNGLGIGFNCARSYNVFSNISTTRMTTGISLSLGPGSKLMNCHSTGVNLPIQLAGYGLSAIGIHAANGSNDNAGLVDMSGSAGYSNALLRRISAHGNIGASAYGVYLGDDSLLDVAATYNNTSYGAVAQDSSRSINGLLTRSNAVGGVATIGRGSAVVLIRNSNIQEAIKYASVGTAARITAGNDRVYEQDYGQTVGTHLITFRDSGTFSTCSTIGSATDQRHTASGIAWKFQPKSTARGSELPLVLSVAKIAVTANNLVTLSIWTYRDNTNIAGQFRVRGGQIAGVGADVTVACTPGINTWTQSGNLTFTPTAAGVVEVEFLVWDGVGTTNNFWVDDISIAQA